MRLYKQSECWAFDDVLLVPNKKSEGLSRLDVDLSTKIGSLDLRIPIISSPMDTVTESDMVREISRLGGMGVLHRFQTPKEQANMIRVNLLPPNQSSLVVPAIGVTKVEMERAEYLYKTYGNQIDMFSIDVANGYHILMADAVKYIQDMTGGDVPIMAGNVATSGGFYFLAELGVSAIRVGIGGGSICKTRIQTGFGMPTLASVDDCAKAARETGVSMIADGGIKYPMDIVKSIAAGANAVMCGGILAGTKEAPGELIYTNDGKAWKKYRGMASAEVQNEKKGGMKKGTCAEGVSTLTPYKGSLERVVDEFTGGLRSALTYNNSRNLSELQETAEFIIITGSGLSESHAYGTVKR
jgi:IMP dehydrogenase